jgi:hypothetical protein
VPQVLRDRRPNPLRRSAHCDIILAYVKAPHTVSTERGLPGSTYPIGLIGGTPWNTVELGGTSCHAFGVRGAVIGDGAVTRGDTLSIGTTSRNIIKGRRAVLAGVGAAAGLAAALTLGPGSANSATIDQMSAQGQLARGGLACVGPFAADAKDIVAGSGSAFQINEFGVPVGVAVDWQLRRADPGTDFFADAAVIQTAHADFFSTSIQPGGKFLPGNFWVCVSPGVTALTAAPQYKMFVGNGLPA